MSEKTTIPLTSVDVARLAPVVLILLGILLFFVNLGHPLYTKGEPREGVQVEDIVEGRGAILPSSPSVEMPYKPPMMRWLAALASEAIGHVDELSIRLPSAVLATATMLATFFYVKSLFGAVEGLVASLILGTTLQFFQAASGARVDMTFTFFLSVALFEFYYIAEGCDERWFLFYLTVACAVLSKGPLGIILPGLVGGVWFIYRRLSLDPARLHLRGGILLIGCIAGAWYIAAIIKGGYPFVERQIISENLYAFLSHRNLGGGHNHPFYWLELALLVGFLPYSVALPWLVRSVIRRRPLEPSLAYFLTWIVSVLIFFNLARQKRGVYLLPIYPALAAVLSVHVIDWSRRKADADSYWVKALAYTIGTIAMASAVGLLFLTITSRLTPALTGYVLSGIGIKASSLAANINLLFWRHVGIALLLTIALGVASVIAFKSVPDVWYLFGSTVFCMTCLKLIADIFFVPAIAQTLTLKTFALQIPRLIGSCEIAYVGDGSYGIAFYYRRPIRHVSADGSDLPPYLLVWRKEYDRLYPVFGPNYSPLMVSGPTELDGSGGIILLARKDITKPTCR